MRDLIGSMLKAAAIPSARSQALARVHLAELLLLAPLASAADKARLRSRIAENSQKRIVQAAEACMSDHLTEPVRTAEIARMIGVSESTLRHSFKRATESTVADRLEELRASRAKELLRVVFRSRRFLDVLGTQPSIPSVELSNA